MRLRREEGNMKLTADYHTHTFFSDGKAAALDNARAAERLGLEAIAITEHGFSHHMRGLKRKETAEWLEMVHTAQRESSIRVLKGMECNIRGVSGKSDFTEKDYEIFDIFLAGIHVIIRYDTFADSRLGWGGWLREVLHAKPTKREIRDTTRAYINTIEKNPVDAITHLNFQCNADAVEVAKCCRDYGTYLEISSKKLHLTDDELAAVANTGVRFIINSDAHSPDRIGDLKLAEEQILRVGVPLDQIDNIDGRTPNFRFAEFKKHM